MQEGDVILGLLFPTNQNTSEAVQPTVGSLHDPAPGPLAGLFRDFLGLLTPRANMSRKTELNQGISHFLIVVSFVQTHILRLFLRWFWTVYNDALYRLPHQFHIVAIGPFYRQTNRHAVPLGQKAPFGALLAPVGGVSARIFPSQRGLCYRPVHTQPFPVYPFQFIKALHSDLPESEKDPGLYPFLETVMGGGAGNQIGRIQGLPLATGAQHVENGIGALSIWPPGATSTQRVSVPVLGKKGLEHLPQFIGNTKAGGSTLSIMKLIFAMGLNTPKYGQMRSL